MGRMNRSRKRRDEMNKIKKARYDAKELVRLKKTLGLIDAEGNEIMQDLSAVATVKTGEELKRAKGKQLTKEEQELAYELEEEREQGEQVKVVNESTKKVHVYNSKTLRDQYGNYPPWFKRKTAKHMRKKAHALKQRFKQAWTTVNVPL